MSDANRVNLAYVEEATFGVTGSAPTFTDLRYTSESLGQDTNTTRSQEIRSDRQTPDVIRTNIQGAGDINFELSYGEYDPLFEAGLLSADWSAPVTNTGTYGTHASNNSFTGTGCGIGIVANQWIRTSGFTTAANNGYFKVTAATSDEVTVAQTITNADAGDADEELEMGAQIVNGTELRWFSFEKEYLDLSNIFEVGVGNSIDQISLNVSTDAIITGSLSVLGKSFSSGTSTAGDGSNTASQTGSVMNAIDNVSKVEEGGATYAITALTQQLQNNLRARQQVGTLGAISIGTGTVAVSGTVQAYFNTAAVMDKYLNFTATNLAYVLLDAAGNAYVVDMPQVKYTNGRRVAGGINQDVIADMTFEAYRDSAEDVTIRIARWPV